jgi:branched-chain amino acid transport system substrate-binding protein
MKIAGASGGDVDGIISTNYLNLATTANANTAGAGLARQVIQKYAPNLDLNDSNVVYGLGAAWTMVYALQHAGKTPTRAGLMRALKSMHNVVDPFAYPGIKLNTSANDNFPIEQEVLIKWSGGATGQWNPFGKLYNNVR